MEMKGIKSVIADMPKLHSPFIRETIAGEYVATPKIAYGYEWVFEDDSVIAVEKLHGTNVSIVIENGVIVSIWNRTQQIPFFCRGKSHIVMGVQESFSRGYCDLPDGQHFGELIGPRVNGNEHKLDKSLWIPFDTYARNHLAYKSWGKYPKTFGAISDWFKNNLFSLLRCKTHGEKPDPTKFCEGVVFVQPSTGKMAKLRRDMFDWFQGRRHG